MILHWLQYFPKADEERALTIHENMTRIFALPGSEFKSGVVMFITFYRVTVGWHPHGVRCLCDAHPLLREVGARSLYFILNLKRQTPWPTFVTFF